MGLKSNRCVKGLTGCDPLCNERIRHVLYIACTSPEPLSSTQIRDRMGKQFHDHSRSIYTIIGRLCPIITRANFHKYVRYLGAAASVSYLHATPIAIDEPKIRTRGTPTSKLLVDAGKEQIAAYVEYRDLIQSPSTRRIEEETIKTKEARLDSKQKRYATLLRRTYGYSPDLRTLMLYLFNESCLRRVSVFRIRSVLSTQNIVDVVTPFLKGWQDFEECGFNVCNVLLTISREFRNQLHIDDTSLSLAIMERYYEEAEKFFDLVCSVSRSDFLETNKRNKLIDLDKLDRLPEIQNEYRKYIIPLIGQMIERKRKILEGYARQVQIFEWNLATNR